MLPHGAPCLTTHSFRLSSTFDIFFSSLAGQQCWGARQVPITPVPHC